MAISEHTRGVSGAIGWALERLKTELPPHLHYHNLFHTELDVLPAARQLANDLALNVEETDLVLIAAAFHDIGFTRQYNDHERAGIDIAAGILPEFGLDDAQIAKISGMIPRHSAASISSNYQRANPGRRRSGCSWP